MENREVINDVLVHLFNEIMELEEQAIITEEYKDITNNDMHIIIGDILKFLCYDCLGFSVHHIVEQIHQ